MIKTIIKFTILFLIVAWIYGMFADYSVLRKVEPVQDNCTMNSQVNNCIVLSTESKIDEPMPEGKICFRQPDGSWEDCFDIEDYEKLQSR